MKMDTTTWILLAILLFLLLRKQQATQAGSLSGGYYPSGAAGAAGAAGKTSLLQQLLGGTGNTQKPPAGVSVGGGAGGGGGGGSTNVPTPIKLPSWLLPARNPVALQPSPTLTSLIPSIPPDTYTPPWMPYPGDTTVATIPSDTSGLFLMPDEPPSYDQPTMTYTGSGTGSTITFLDPTTGADITNTVNPNAGMQAPVGNDQSPDSTFFSPVDTQTIDTSTLGSISYLDSPTFSSTDTSNTSTTQWYDPVSDTLTSSSGGGYDNTGYYDDPLNSFDDS